MQKGQLISKEKHHKVLLHRSRNEDSKKDIFFVVED
jgi:hypothetical protein